MKRFVVKIAFLFLIIACADFVIGQGLEYMTSQIKVGGQGRDNYIVNETTEEILIFGSSRAIHHYNAKMIEDSLGLTCYNCGENGSGIILSYGRLLMIEERHKPQIIIQDITPNCDIITNDNHRYLGWLKAHYEKVYLHPIFEDIDKKEKFKMKSYLYRYNSRCIQTVVTYLSGKANDDGVNGFRPLKEKFDKMKLREEKNNNNYEVDQLKIDYINHFIDLANGVQLVFVVSPVWYGMDSTQLNPIRKICNERGILFWDFSNNPKYVHRDEFFKDGMHMNAEGADEFTNDLIECLKKMSIHL